MNVLGKPQTTVSTANAPSRKRLSRLVRSLLLKIAPSVPVEKFSKWRDPSTGIAPFLYPLPPSGETVSLPVKLLYPFTFILAAIRTTLVAIILLLQFLVVDVLLGVCLVIPPVHALLSRAFTSVASRLVLVLLGFFWIPVESASLKRTARSSAVAASSPSKGDIIIANSSSFVDVLYLAFRYNPTFLLPVSSTGSKTSSASSAKITSYRRVSLFSAILASGTLPERSERGESLEEASKAARGPVVLFPECTTSNNRALLKFGAVLETHNSKPSTFKTFIISFKYDLPTPLLPSAVHPYPTSPFTSMFKMTTSPLARTLVVRKLHPAECPKLSSSPRNVEMEQVGEALAGTGRWKKTTGMDWEAKAQFLEFRKSRQ
ncbi:hypothetical protein MNV49_004285 [Pseudohyphozyma bogoriensis]|nr:hypothetical protein MNV49_004285 [Pseudohyphozyma bogoriensis]